MLLNSSYKLWPDQSAGFSFLWNKHVNKRTIKTQQVLQTDEHWSGPFSSLCPGGLSHFVVRDYLMPHHCTFRTVPCDISVPYFGIHALGEKWVKAFYFFSRKFQFCVHVYLCHLDWTVSGATLVLESWPWWTWPLAVQPAVKQHGVQCALWAFFQARKCSYFEAAYDGSWEWRRDKQGGVCLYEKNWKNLWAASRGFPSGDAELLLGPPRPSAIAN